jgi:hypothetical protein
MVQALIEIGEREDRVLTIVKGKYGLKTKSQAINFLIDKYEKDFMEDFLDGEIRPEYAAKIAKMVQQGNLRTYTSLEELRKEIEDEALHGRKRTREKTPNPLHKR